MAPAQILAFIPYIVLCAIHRDPPPGLPLIHGRPTILLYFSAQFAMLIAQCSCFLRFTFISLFFHICGYLYPHVFVLPLYSNINALVVYLYLSLLRHLRCSLLMYQRIVAQYSAVQGCINALQWVNG